jgi:gliding motility-associated-like protein
MRFFTTIFFLLFTHIILAQVTPAERAALQAFYTATGGDNWTSQTDADISNDWDFSGPVTNAWKGLSIAGGNVRGIDMNTSNLYGEGNNLTGIIPDELANLQNLVSLDISGANLSGSLPISLTTIPTLTSLNLWGNNLTGDIPIEVTTMTQLTYLNLYYNSFTGFIRPEYGNLTNLTYLDLSENELTGTVPVSLGNISSLRYLILGGQSLTGTLPTSLSNLANLIELSIASTYISGEIPTEYGQLINLEKIDLSSYSNILDGGLTGSIPDSFGNLTKLKKIDLWGNALSGSIPVSLANLVDLQEFKISHNDISGTLSPTFSSWVNINDFSVLNNKIEGTIPDSYSVFSNIEVFAVNDNLLSGTLPPNFSLWQDLEIFNIYNNQFTGTIPDVYTQWSNIKNISIQNNNFEGTLPNFTGNTSLNTFIIRDNNFQFGDFENEFNTYIANISIFTDNPQAKVNAIEDLSSCVGSSITLSTVVSGSANVYQWLKDGTAITGANNADLALDPVAVSDAGVYTCLITSTIVTDLTLERNPITLNVSATGPTANTVNDILACDLDADGFATFSFDFADIESQAFGSQAGLTISYFDSSGNPLPLTSSYNNTTANSQEITVRVSDMGGCYDESIFNLVTILPETADIIADVVACNSYTLTDLSPGNNYYTATNIGGTQLQAGDLITATQTVYIYAGTGSCADETSFTVTIDQPITIDQLGDVIECESFTLATLTNGDYFTESNGQGTMLNVGDTITETQTIYIYNQSGSCSDESSFTVSINTTIIADTLADVVACNSYTLTDLSPGNNYYTATNIGGTQLQAGDLITATQTVYIYAGTGSCADETSFTVTIDQPITIDQLGDVIECESFTLATLTNGDYFTESNGQGTMLNVGDTITETQTIYIYNQSGSCSDESRFSISIDLLACSDSDDAIKAKFPKFFTPNNDGINDFWKADQELFTIEGTISIYDRYGKLLAQFDAENGGWDGSYNGIMLPATDYWFRFKTPDGAITSSGHFSLKR